MCPHQQCQDTYYQRVIINDADDAGLRQRRLSRLSQIQKNLDQKEGNIMVAHFPGCCSIYALTNGFQPTWEKNSLKEFIMAMGLSELRGNSHIYTCSPLSQKDWLHFPSVWRGRGSSPKHQFYLRTPFYPSCINRTSYFAFSCWSLCTWHLWTKVNVGYV